MACLPLRRSLPLRRRSELALSAVEGTGCSRDRVRPDGLFSVFLWWIEKKGNGEHSDVIGKK